MHALALAIIPLQVLVGGTVPERSCPGPETNRVLAELGPSDRYRLSPALQDAFARYWHASQRVPQTVQPDSVTALASGTAKLIVVLGRQGCALGVVELAVTDVARALRRAIGPAI